jgi:beta-glucosidase
MISYSSWNDVVAGTDQGKMHGNKELITGALKGKMGFDGLVVSDWNAIEQVPGCARAHCPQAINAGIDMVMVPDDWKQFIAETMKDVETGVIPMSRIDDAVTRILRVKMRSGLFAIQVRSARCQ